MKNARLLSRREATQSIFATLGGAILFACAGGGDDDVSGSGGSVDGDAGTGTTTDGSSSTVTNTGSADSWASGGTKSMTKSYASPFPLAGSAACLVMSAETEGPCTEAADQVRQDISEGYTGLPVRLALRFVDSSCNPISGAKVKIWHTQLTGSYSGNTPNPGMCLKDQSDTAKHYFRGVQTTDADGRVDFDTCFPGWYRGRAIHIHFTVTANGKSFTSQLSFDPTLIQEIFTSHEEYKSFGQPDTPNASDNIVGGADAADFVLVTSRLDDGALMAAKEIQVSA